MVWCHVTLAGTNEVTSVSFTHAHKQRFGAWRNNINQIQFVVCVYFGIQNCAKFKARFDLTLDFFQLRLCMLWLFWWTNRIGRGIGMKLCGNFSLATVFISTSVVRIWLHHDDMLPVCGHETDTIPDDIPTDVLCWLTLSSSSAVSCSSFDTYEFCSVKVDVSSFWLWPLVRC